MGEVRVDGVRSRRWGAEEEASSAPSGDARTAAERLDGFVRTSASGDGSAAAAAAWAAAKQKPACGNPGTAPSIPPAFKADDPDAIRRWLDPAYAEQRKAEELAAAMRAAVAKQQLEDRLRFLVVPTPEALKQTAVLGPIAIPIAEKVHTVATLTPILGELVAGAEAITGNGLFGLGEKLSDEERSLNALLATTLVAGAVLEAGVTGARAVLRLAQSTGRSIEEVITALKAARSLKSDEVVLREALALRKSGLPLEPRHEAALQRAGRALQEVRGAARHSRFHRISMARSLMSEADKVRLPEFRPNPDGPRTVTQAVEIARRNGVHIPSWIRFDAGREMKEGFAEYRLLKPEMLRQSTKFGWSEIAPEGVIHVRLSEAALASDEALTAAIEHECYELTRLRRMLETGERYTPFELDRLVNERTAGNLHDEAWEVADIRVMEMRAQTPEQREVYRQLRTRKLAEFDTRRFGSEP